MPTVNQVLGRQAVTELDDGMEKTTIVYYPDRISPRIMRQYVQLVMLPTIQIAAPSQEALDAMDEDAKRQMIAHIGEQAEQQVMSRIDNVASILSTLIASWNLTEETGEMVALTTERLAELGFAFLARVFQQLMEAVRMGESKGAKPNGHLNGTSGAKHRPKRRS